MKLKKQKAVERARKDENGNIIRDNNGNAKMRYGWYYALVGATPEELTKCKTMQTQDGNNYYREEKGYPILWLNENIGNEADVEFYVNKEGRIGLSADKTDIIELRAQIEKYADNPALVQHFAMELEARMRKGSRLNLETVIEKESIENESDI